jgi:hypothetical protein
MRANLLFRGIIAAAILFGSGPLLAAARTRILAEPAEIQEISCRGLVTLDENGRIESCTLARDCTLAGYPLPAGSTVRFRGDLQVASFVLGQPATIAGFMLPADCEVRLAPVFTGTLRGAASVRGVSLPAGSTIFFRTPAVWESEVPDTWHCWLPANTLIQARHCRSTEDGCGVIFYPSGKLRAAALAQDTEIDGVPCTSSHNPFRLGRRVLFYGLDVRAWFYESGHLAQGMVSRKCRIGGRDFKPGDIVRLTPTGALDPSPTTLGAASRRADQRTPPESALPRPGPG